MTRIKRENPKDFFFFGISRKLINLGIFLQDDKKKKKLAYIINKCNI